MRRTTFNEPVLQPGDDFYAEWQMYFDEEPDGEIARFIEQDDGKWGCEIADNNERSMQVNDFTSREALVEWLEEQKIENEA